MGLTHFPHGISSFGVPQLGGAGLIPQTTGTYFFVDDSGSNANDGKDPDHPFADLDYAIGQCTADHGDIIIVMPGHAETVAATIAVDVAGIQIIGLGNGEARPTFTHDGTLADDLVEISADSAVLKNMKLVGAANCTGLINITGDGDYAVIDSVEFSAGAAPVKHLTMETGADDVLITGCRFIGTAAGTDAFVITEGKCNRLRITNSYFDDTSAAGSDIGMISFTVTSNEVLIDHCTFVTETDGDIIVQGKAASGNVLVAHCDIICADATDIWSPTNVAAVIETYAAEDGTFAGGAMISSSTQPQTTPAA